MTGRGGFPSVIRRTDWPHVCVPGGTPFATRERSAAVLWSRSYRLIAHNSSILSSQETVSTEPEARADPSMTGNPRNTSGSDNVIDADWTEAP